MLRLAGASRYETSVEISKYLEDNFDYDDLVLASGLKGMDALIATGLAADKEASILLCQDKALPSEVEAYLRSDNDRDIYVMSSNQDIQTSVINEIKTKDLAEDIERLNTGDLSATASILAGMTHDDSNSAVLVSSDPSKMVDALAAGPYAYLNNSPILVTEAGSLNHASKDYLKKENISKVSIVGGTNTISQKVEDELLGRQAEPSPKPSESPKEPSQPVKPSPIVDKPSSNNDVKKDILSIDTDGNGIVTIAEAKRAGYSMPIYSSHWLYPYMIDKNNNSMVGENSK